jgi:CRP-like cAMP-binding protein
MTEHDAIAMLRDLRFLRDASPELVSKLAGVSRIVEYPEQAVIFREGQPARAVYLIVEGKVALEICASGAGCKRIMTVEGGELLGWSPLLGHERLTATARTLTATRAVELDATQLLALAEAEPRLGYELMKRAALALAKRLSATRLQFIDVYGSQLPAIPDDHRQTAH